MTIQPITLKTIRERFPMSQQDLAEVSGVSKKTIARIETGKSDPNATTVKRLATALRVTTEALSKGPNETSDADARIRDLGYKTLKTLIDAETALAFEIVERLYGIPVRSQVLMAPLFAALLAEGSFAWRREKLTAIDDAAARLMALGGPGHTSFANAAYRVQEAAVDEDASIASHDLFGGRVGQDAFDFGYDPSQHNPFADYLREFADEFDSTKVKFDPAGYGEWKTPEGLPHYEVSTTYLTGGDRWAKFALMNGHARVRDIPEELMGEDSTPNRIEWLASKIPAEVRAQQEEFLRQLDIDLKNLLD